MAWRCRGHRGGVLSQGRHGGVARVQASGRARKMRADGRSVCRAAGLVDSVATVVWTPKGARWRGVEARGASCNCARRAAHRGLCSTRDNSTCTVTAVAMVGAGVLLGSDAGGWDRGIEIVEGGAPAVVQACVALVRDTVGDRAHRVPVEQARKAAGRGASARKAADCAGLAGIWVAASVTGLGTDDIAPARVWLWYASHRRQEGGQEGRSQEQMIRFFSFSRTYGVPDSGKKGGKIPWEINICEA